MIDIAPGRRHLFATSALTAVVLLATACDDSKKAAPPEPPSPSASPMPTLGLDAGALIDPIDPPAPAGDLKAELDRFVNVDTCVAERAKLDPLVGDALGAIGYETFLRDACRLLEAAKDKKRETCDKIDSSALRSRCQSWVAMVAQTPDACPMQFEGIVTRGRNPSCVAIAAKDPRLCAGEARVIQRGTCEALTLRDPKKCESLLPSHRALCQREVERWKSVLATPLEGLEPLPVPKGKLTVRGSNGTPDPPSTEVDLSSDFARGVVVVVSSRGSQTIPGAGDRLRVELGTVVESEAARIAASPQKKPRVGLALLLEPGKTTAKPALQKLELELPGEATIVSPPSACDCKITSARASTTRGGEAAISLEGTLNGAGAKTYKVTIDLLTFVRDVVPEQPGTRVLPPIHPTLPGLGARPATTSDGGL